MSEEDRDIYPSISKPQPRHGACHLKRYCAINGQVGRRVGDEECAWICLGATRASRVEANWTQAGNKSATSPQVCPGVSTKATCIAELLRHPIISAARSEMLGKVTQRTLSLNWDCQSTRCSKYLLYFAIATGYERNAFPETPTAIKIT